MRYSKCPGIEKDWSHVTLGCWQIAPSEGWGDICSADTVERVVKTALDSGITAYDTAEGYGDGKSERRLSKALGSQKDEVIIISKIWPDAELTLEGYQNRLDTTLKNLDRDYVDLYLIHWPGDYFNAPEKANRLCDLLCSLKASGKAQTIGLSNFQYTDLSLIKDRLSEFAINQVPYSLLDRRYEGNTLSLCQKEDVRYMIFAPKGRGLLARPLSKEDRQYSARQGKYFEEPLFSEALKVYSVVESISKEQSVKPVEVALAWTLAQTNIQTAIVGTRKPEQIAEAAKGADCVLSPEHIEELTNASNTFLETATDFSPYSISHHSTR